MRIRFSLSAVILAVGWILVWGIMVVTGREEIGAADALAVVAASVLHELGHMAAAWGWSVTTGELRVDLFGARMELKGMMGYAAELAVAAGGPFVSLVTAALANSRGPFGAEASLFAAVSLGLGLLNLLPIRGLDGGRMMACGLALLWGDRVADTVLRLTTGIALGGLWLFSIYALLRAGEMLSLFVFAMCLLWRLTGDPS